MLFGAASGKSMHAVDTNVLVRLIARDDAAQTEAAETFVASGGWVSHLVLAESVWVLESVYALSKQQITTTITMLLEHRQLSLEAPDVVRTALSLYQAHNGVGFTDCLILAVAQVAGHTPIGSFDKKMSRMNDVLCL